MTNPSFTGSFQVDATAAKQRLKETMHSKDINFIDIVEMSTLGKWPMSMLCHFKMTSFVVDFPDGDVANLCGSGGSN